jgi:DNA replication protein DnaC
MTDTRIHDPKTGFIRTPSGKSRHETYTWTEKPKCPECHCDMMENDRVIDGKIVFSWWCGEISHCHYSQMASQYNQSMIAEGRSSQIIDYGKYGISPVMAGKTLDNYKCSNRASINDFYKCAKHPFDMLIRGKSGTGKTHLAVAVLKQIIDRGTALCYFQSVPALIFDIQDAYAEQTVNNRPKQIIERFIKYGVLVLDDLGAEKTTEHVQTVLYMIINGRLEQARPTIITTNSTIAQIEPSHGERIASRLNGYLVLSTTGENYRGRR